MTSIHNADDLFLILRDNHIFERFGIKKLGVFGSLARGERFNDIDLLIEDDLDYKSLLELKVLLESQTGYKVDLLQKKYAEPVILHRALKDIRYAAAS
jgi:hypothetical protein